MDFDRASQFGTVVFGPSQPVEFAMGGDSRSTIPVQYALGEWRPSPSVARHFQRDFTVALERYTATDGIRRIVLGGSPEELIDLGTTAGLAILQDRNELDDKQVDMYRVLLQIHQYVHGRRRAQRRGMREHSQRRFQYSRDLYVRRTGRIADGERDVLPGEIGVNAQGEGQRLSVSQLMRLGRAAAVEAGYRQPTSKTAIEFGLYEAAKRNPLLIKTDEAIKLVRMALIDIESVDAVSPQLRDIVWVRLYQAMISHAGDSVEDFRGWFLGSDNSLIKQLAQPKAKDGGRLKQNDVRNALLQLGRDADQYLGPCIDTFVWTVGHSIIPPLSEEEKRMFGRMYGRQPYYGNLPLALLSARTEEIGLAVQAIWNEPQNEEHLRVLHRLLYWYAEMVRKRRRADLQFKQRRQSTDGPSSQGAGVDMEASRDEDKRGTSTSDAPDQVTSVRLPVQFIDSLHSVSASHRDGFDDVAEHIRRLNRLECPHECGDWEYALLKNANDRVVIGARCACGAIGRAITMSQAEFERIATGLLGWRKFKKEDSTVDGSAPDDKS